MSFTSRLTLALISAVLAAALLAPAVAAALAAAGFHFPFPRILDRTVMAAIGAAILLEARALGAGPLLRRGFSRPRANLPRLARGFLAATAALGILGFIAAALGARAGLEAHGLGMLISRYALSAIVIAAIEEGFFRAFLLGGMADELGRGAAAAVSSAIYALAHLVRSPARFYVAGFAAAAGFRTLAASLHNLAQPAAVLPAFVGLFLLGMVLAEAFLQTGTVYFPMGLHAGFVVGAKLWPKMTARGAALPGWLAGWGAPPLISGAAAWAVALALLVLMKPLTRNGPGQDDARVPS